ncbi:MAG TPA: glycoside hydrolase family 127 protein [Tepidisphaeraceae bacterium]
MTTPPAPAATAFALADVTLLDGAFKQAMARNGQYLLSLEADRFLHNTRKYAGLEPKGAIYGGWESRGIAGHSLGHYLTALALQYSATGDNRFRERIDYLVAEMAECQEKYGDGYIGALPPKELDTLRGLAQGKTRMDANGSWVPWYTQHKVIAGLKDAWVLAGSQQAKVVTLKLADWVDRITSGLTPEQQQAMLRIEFGGMNETLVELYALTGEARYLAASKRFYHSAVLDPLLAGRDELSGKHANTQVPKIIGEARRYEVTGDAGGRKIAEHFWDRVVNHHSYAIGGNSDREHFFPVGRAAEHLTAQSAETCNTYNMLKLTEHLFGWSPRPAYGDYYERALYNQILPSQEPTHGMYTYFVSHKPGHFRTYSSPHDSFWCCVGTGMENHTKYGGAIYFKSGTDTLYVNLFIPSQLTWKEAGVELLQETQYPTTDQTQFTVKSAPATPFALQVRAPAWATGPLRFRLNDTPLEVDARPGTFAAVKRVWAAGDRLSVTIPMGLRAEPLNGAPNKIAFMYGPLVLAADLGRVPDSKNFPIAGDHLVNERVKGAEAPVIVAAAGGSPVELLEPVAGESQTFRTREGVGQPQSITFRPFNAMPYQYYNLYTDVLTPAEWDARKSEREALAERERREAARVVDDISPGEQQSETDHNFAGERSNSGVFRDRSYRDARSGGYLSFELKVLPDTPQILRCTYWGEEGGRRTFDVIVDGKVLVTQILARDKPGAFFDVETPLPAEMVRGKSKITVRLQPASGSIAGGLFKCAVLKAAD